MGMAMAATAMPPAIRMRLTVLLHGSESCVAGGGVPLPVAEEIAAAGFGGVGKGDLVGGLVGFAAGFAAGVDIVEERVVGLENAVREEKK